MIIRSMKAGFKLMEMRSILNNMDVNVNNNRLNYAPSLQMRICMWTGQDKVVEDIKENKIEQKIDSGSIPEGDIQIVTTGRKRKAKASVKVKPVKGQPYFTVKGDYLMRVHPKDTHVKPTSGFQLFRAHMIQKTYKGEYTQQELLLCWHYVNQWRRFGRRRGKPNQTQGERDARTNKAIYGDMVNKYKFLEKCGEDFGKLTPTQQQKWNRKAHAINKETQPQIQKYLFPKQKFKNRKQMKEYFYPTNPQNNQKPIVTNEQLQQLEDKFIQMMKEYDQQLKNWLTKFSLSLQEFKKMRKLAFESMQKQKKQCVTGKNRSQKRRAIRRSKKASLKDAKKSNPGKYRSKSAASNNSKSK